MSLCCIYGIKNTVNGKWYVGQTVNLAQRKRAHLSSLRLGKHGNAHLQRAFIQYGEPSLEWHVLEIVPEDMLDVREGAWIEYHHSLDPLLGYNIDAGGRRRSVVSSETRAKISQALTGKKLSDETKQKIRIAHLGMPSPLKGVSLSSEARKNLSLSLTGRKNPHVGHKQSAETVQKRISKTRGQKRTREQKLRISAGRRAYINRLKTL